MVAWLLDNSLWLVAAGLCLASSGIDGAYMAKWMPPAALWLGYILNTVSDVASMVLMYQYGRILQTRRNESGGKRKLELSWALLVAEVLAVLYSWFFSWRQLLIVLPAVEMQATRWVAPLAAGFIPLLLASAGYAQSLLAGRIEEKEETQKATQPAQSETQPAQSETQPAQSETQPVAAIAGDNGHQSHACPYCDRAFAKPQSVSAHLKHCDAYHAHKAQEVAQ